jgi:hypothetical protein
MFNSWQLELGLSLTTFFEHITAVVFFWSPDLNCRLLWCIKHSADFSSLNSIIIAYWIHFRTSWYFEFGKQENWHLQLWTNCFSLFRPLDFMIPHRKFHCCFLTSFFILPIPFWSPWSYDSLDSIGSAEYSKILRSPWSLLLLEMLHNASDTI